MGLPSHTVGRTREGMTLIEVLVVVALIALAAGAVSMSVGALARTKLRSACMRIVAASSFAYNRAVTDGKTLRVVIDMDQGHLSIQESRRKVALAAAGDPQRERMDREDELDAVDPWEAAKERLEDAYRPSFGRSPFGPLTRRDGQPSKRHQNVPFDDGIQVTAMYLPHEPEVRLQGAGAIYYFPTGFTENAVVHLTDGDEARVYAVEIHPLTGRGKVHAFPYEPDANSLQEGLDELRDRR